jgi:hypothetical protein
MRLLCRLGEALALFLSALGILGSVAGVVGTWMCYQTVTEKVQTVAARLDGGLERVSTASENVRRAIEIARADVASVGNASVDLGGESEKSRRTARVLRTLILQQAGPHMDDLGGRLATLSDLAVAVASLLRSFQEFPAAPHFRLEPDQVQRRAEEVQQLSATLRRLETAIGDGDKGTGSGAVAGTTNAVDLILQRCQATVDEWQSDLDAAREDVARVKANVLGCLIDSAVAMTFLCLWFGAGQVSLFARALQWYRGA